VTSDDIMTSLLKKLSISIKIHVVKPLCSVSKLFLTESVGSRRELQLRIRVHTADADATRLFHRFGVGGVYWASATNRPNWFLQATKHFLEYIKQLK